MSTGLITGSVDKTIKMWNMQANPPEPQSIAVDGEVQHMSIAGSCLVWANSVCPPYTPSDPVGVVEMMDLAANTRSKCVVRTLAFVV